ncbi:unnamed protein product, partial [Laminaria digitata]
LIEAAISAIHARGSLDITMSHIATRAGVSQGLAHHYFGSKEQLIVSAMRHLLTEFGASVREELRSARSPRARVTAVINASLASDQFQPECVSAWLVFYVHAQSSPEARRLYTIYARRLHSNLAYALRPIAKEKTNEVAEGVSAMIDGLYIRAALGPNSLAHMEPRRLVESYVDCVTGS